MYTHTHHTLWPQQPTPHLGHLAGACRGGGRQHRQQRGPSLCHLRVHARDCRLLARLRVRRHPRHARRERAPQARNPVGWCRRARVCGAEQPTSAHQRQQHSAAACAGSRSGQCLTCCAGGAHHAACMYMSATRRRTTRRRTCARTRAATTHLPGLGRHRCHTLLPSAAAYLRSEHQPGICCMVAPRMRKRPTSWCVARV
jgi:hypothetical protein